MNSKINSGSKMEIKSKCLYVPLIILLAVFSIEAQIITGRESNKQLDINSKAKELGISTEQLSGILNSASSGNGEGDPLPDALTERFFTGQAEYNQFGYSVSSAGDVNGDGYDDIVVGANFNSAGRGKVYLYFGGIVPDYLPDAIFSGSNTGGQFGFSVSSAGDVNADGYDDIIIGAPFEDGTAGRATIVFGNATMATYSVLTLFDPPAQDYDDNFGISVSGAGDLNGDGYDDVIVGAPSHEINGLNMGAAFIYYGGSSMDATWDLSLLPDGPGSTGEFGGNVSKAGDINGDGYADVIVGAPADGVLSVYLGGVSMNNIADLDVGGFIGTTAGDVNGDGYDDFIIGYQPNVYIYFGGAIPDITPDVTISGSSPDQFGSSVSKAGDVNGDGYDDVIIGANNFNSATGRAYVYFGGESMDNVKDVILTGSFIGDLFGFSVSDAGDFNGDGYDDMLVGAPLNDAGGTGAGRAYLYLNSLIGPDIPDEFFTGESTGDQLGRSVSNAGDVNGDGYDDIVVGAPYNDVSQTDGGRAYIYYGGPGFDNTPDVILLPIEFASDRLFGFSVSGAGDVDADGYDDVIVGSPGLSGTNYGTFYIFYGGNPMDGNYDLLKQGAAGGDRLGCSVSMAGDVNGDGFSDVIVGAYGNDAGGTDAGRAYIFFGGAAMNSEADVIMTGQAANDFFGSSVSSAGDVNGDGYSDVIIGAYQYPGGAGRAYIYFGNATMDNIPDVIFAGSANYDFLGCSVSTAGDVNADGYSDIIVGVYGAINGSGKAYIYFGGASMDNIADVTLTSAATDYEFGISVSLAGDVNKDGYSDVFVGSAQSYTGGSYAGCAYIYFGGQVMDNSLDILMTGEANDDFFGNSVSSAGDVNGDGYSDVIVGAYLNDAGGTDAGSAYLYLSSSPPIKPPLKSVKDIPFDQGGYVRVRWNRSGYDIRGQNRVADYILQRSDPPGTSGFVWDYIVTVPAIKASEYSYVSPTPSDSSSNTSGTFYFRVIARGTNPEEMWYSNIIYGHSADNLAPAAPFNFYANLNGSNVKLGWKANTEEDFRDYLIYRSDTPVGDAFTLIGTTTDTTFIDDAPLTGNAYYYIQAYDVHDNGSAYSSDSIMAFLSANIKVLLEGSYDAGGVMRTTLNLQGIIPLTQPFNTDPWNYTGTETVTTVPINVTDWILVELRSTITTLVDRRAAFLKNDGTLVDLDGVSNIKFPTATAADYYVVIYHRNHLSVMTKVPVTISFNPTLYDMRTDINKAYGTNAMKSLGGGYYGVYTADTDGSGTVNAADRSNTWNQRNQSAYLGTDVDLSGTVNAADRSTVWNNRNLSTQVPTPLARPITEIVKEN